MKTLVIFLLTCLSSVTYANANNDKPQTLVIYTYQSFISGGIVEQIKPLFEAQCKTCTLEFIGLNDAQGIINRLQIEGENSKADLILGIDNNLMADAVDLVQPSDVDLAQLKLPIAWDNQSFIPYDYGYFAFIYDQQKLQNVPANFTELIASDTSILIQDPRVSSPGFGLLLWIKAAYPNQSQQIWTGLKDNIVTVSKGWSEAYGLFLAGEADMVLSYTSSPFYHQLAEGNDNYEAALFDEGHYLQVEVAAISKYSKNVELANQFLNFMLSVAFQKRIPESNWMFPVTNVADIPPPFLNANQPKTLPLLSSDNIKDNKNQWINEWLEAL